MLKKVVLVLGIVVVAFLGFVATRPASYKVERSITVGAPAEVAFTYLSDFHNWSAWSPWDKLDPNMKRTYSGSPAGVGAGYAWVGNDKVGEGKMTIVDAKPNERVAIKLEFLKPWASTANTTFGVKPSGEQVAVTWTMEGHNDFAGKAMSVFMNMDKMIGSDFEKGLAALKPLVEAEAAKRVAEAKAAEAKAAEEKAAAEAAAGEGKPAAN